MAKTNYGIDAPKVIRNLLAVGVIALSIGICAIFIHFPYRDSVCRLCFTYAFFFFLPGALMLLYALKGKFRHRDRMLDLYEWKGTENVLDIGTGLGLLMIGAAKRLSSGKAIGIDIWNSEDLSNNTLTQTKQNINLENVSGNAEVVSENILNASFQGKYFDVILSNLCLHNIYDKTLRENACKEIFRLLKDNGTVILSDFRHTKEYFSVFEKLGMKTDKVGTYYFDTFPPLTIIRAKKQ